MRCVLPGRRRDVEASKLGYCCRGSLVSPATVGAGIQIQASESPPTAGTSTAGTSTAGTSTAGTVAEGTVTVGKSTPKNTAASGSNLPITSSTSANTAQRRPIIEGDTFPRCRCVPAEICPPALRVRRCVLPGRRRDGLIFSSADIRNREASKLGYCCLGSLVSPAEAGTGIPIEASEAPPTVATGTAVTVTGGESTSKDTAVSDSNFDLVVADGAKRPVFSETVVSGGRSGERQLLERSPLPAGAKVFLRRMALDSGDNVARRAVVAPRRRSRLFATVAPSGGQATPAAQSARSAASSATVSKSMQFLRSVGVVVSAPSRVPPPSVTSRQQSRNLRPSAEAQQQALGALQLLQQTRVRPRRTAGTAAGRSPRPGARRRVKRSAMPPPPSPPPVDDCSKRLPGRCIEREKVTRCLRRRYGVCIRRGSAQGKCIKRLPGKCIELEVQNCQNEPDIKCKDRPLRYRFINGQCNNMNQPRWGRQMTGLRRLMDNTFEDGVFAPRSLSAAGGLLPDPRAVSLGVFHSDGEVDQQRTVSVVTFGQFVDHDLSLSPTFGRDAIECCREDLNGSLPLRQQHPQCLPLKVAADDPLYKGKKARRCISFTRTMPALDPQCMAKPATQVNELTSWADLSQVYGSTDDLSANHLRSSIGGALRTSKRGNFLPRRGDPDDETLEFLAGDGRVSENLLLSLFHTVFLREHNRVAASLAARHSWHDERLFEEARRLVIAEYQHVLFNEWLPALLGEKFTKDVGLSGDFGRKTYSDIINPSVSTEFSTAGFRLHSMVQGVVELATRVGRIRRRIPLMGNFFRSNELVVAAQLVEMARGITRTPAMRFDGSFSDELRGGLFQFNPDQKGGGVDLTALNIQRGRDHGIPTYSTVASRCNNIPIRSWSDLHQTIPEADVRRLRSIYRDWRDIDLYAGLNLERRAAGALVGPSTRCLITDQFLRTRYGDRFFFDHDGHPNSFNEDQRKEIRRTSWARLLCDNVGSGFDSVQPRAFLAATGDNKVVSCQSRSIDRVDLTKF
ncbi:peroxidase-like [Amphibalanus amphitrite]|nr:peroxidase-like [Amphibalanus amphitrite]